MAHYFYETDDQGEIARVLKDGKPYSESVTLEQAYSIVTIYFRTAADALQQIDGTEERDRRRMVGLQAFMMSMTGLEAFTNVYFHFRAIELGSDAILDRIAQKHGSLPRRITDLLALTPDGLLVEHVSLMQRVHQLVQLRNEIVHPRWIPSKLTIDGITQIHIEGLVENRQAVFEDITVSREALWWCLLVVARIGQARGNQDLRGFLFHWTGNYDLTLDALLACLDLPT